MLVRGSKNLSAPRIPHASSASRSYPLLQRPSGTRPASPLAHDRRSVSPVTAGRPWPPSLGLTDPTTTSRRPRPLGRALIIDPKQGSLPQTRFACRAQGCEPLLATLPGFPSSAAIPPRGARPNPLLGHRAPGVRIPDLGAACLSARHGGLSTSQLPSRSRGTRNLPSSLPPRPWESGRPLSGVTRACVMDRTATAGGKWATPL